MLRDEERPPPAVAQSVIGGVLRHVFLQYARVCAVATVVLMGAAVVLGSMTA